MQSAFILFDGDCIHFIKTDSFVIINGTSSMVDNDKSETLTRILADNLFQPSSGLDRYCRSVKRVVLLIAQTLQLRSLLGEKYCGV